MDDDRKVVLSCLNEVRAQLRAEREAGLPEEDMRAYFDAVRDFRSALEGDDKWALARVALTIGHFKGQYDFVAKHKQLIDKSETLLHSSPWSISERRRAVDVFFQLIGRGKTARQAERIVGRAFRKNGLEPRPRTIREWRTEFNGQ
jgi:hypothetical protein